MGLFQKPKFNDMGLPNKDLLEKYVGETAVVLMPVFHESESGIVKVRSVWCFAKASWEHDGGALEPGQKVRVVYAEEKQGNVLLTVMPE
ncbi:MAG: NfeD family protein [Bacteroidota bacterium]